jgi:acetyltransferase-like isoleucine patch superfamily enzyme
MGGVVTVEKRFENWNMPKFDKDGFTKYGWRCQHPEKLKLDYGVDIGCFTYLNAKYGIKIGKDVQIGPHCTIHTNSTIDGKTGIITIEDGAKIGAYSMVMPNISIGKNAVIGAYSFVNRNIPDNVIAYGVPVKIIRKNMK